VDELSKNYLKCMCPVGDGQGIFFHIGKSPRISFLTLSGNPVVEEREHESKFVIQRIVEDRIYFEPTAS